MAAIEISGLTKDYKAGFWRRHRFRALDGLNLEIREGEIFGLLGPNGAGKTTTQKLLLRLIFPTAGSARILGCPISDVAVHHRIGYLPENPYFYDYLTAEELLHYVGRLFGVRTAERKKRVRNLLNQVNIGTERRKSLRKLSKGMLQRVGIAQALINDPEIIFLDEPLSGLDPIGRREIRDLILQLKAHGKTIFLSTHILADAEMICDRVAILHHGQLKSCGELHEILRMGTASTEIVLHNPSGVVLDAVKALTRGVTRTGDRVCVRVSNQEHVMAVIDLARRHQVPILALNPIKKSLEDYFMESVAAPKEENSSVGNPPEEDGKEPAPDEKIDEKTVDEEVSASETSAGKEAQGGEPAV